VPHQKSQLLLGRQFSGHYEIALVLAVCVVCHHDHPPAGEGRDRLLHGFGGVQHDYWPQSAGSLINHAQSCTDAIFRRAPRCPRLRAGSGAVASAAGGETRLGRGGEPSA
jgi:hypothetical protein